MCGFSLFCQKCLGHRTMSWSSGLCCSNSIKKWIKPGHGFSSFCASSLWIQIDRLCSKRLCTYDLCLLFSALLKFTNVLWHNLVLRLWFAQDHLEWFLDSYMVWAGPALLLFYIQIGWLCLKNTARHIHKGQPRHISGTSAALQARTVWQETFERDSLALLARTFLHVTDLFSSVLPVQLDRPPRPVSVHQRAPSVSYYALLFTLADGYGRLLLPLAFACFGSKEMPSIK